MKIFQKGENKMNNWKVFTVAFVASLVIVAGGTTAYLHHTANATSQEPACTDTATEKCPNDYFSAQYRKFKKLQASTIELQQRGTLDEYNEKQDQLRGMGMRLTEMQPQGFQWNEKKWKFVQTPPPAASTSGPNSPAVTGNGNTVVNK
jgi:hypothetical protein